MPSIDAKRKLVGAPNSAERPIFDIARTSKLQTVLAMGRYDFRPSRVHQRATQLLATQRLSTPPPWFDVVGSIPPSQILVRTQPVQHQQPASKSRRKASKMFRPQPITYEEDRLRRDFFADHPWELARPRVILEDDGKDSRHQDWSSMQSAQNGLSGER